MKKNVLRKVLTLVLAVIFVGSAAVVGVQIANRQQAVDSYEDAVQIALPQAPVQTEVPAEPEFIPEPAPERPTVQLPDEKLPMVIMPEDLKPCPLPDEAQFLLNLDLEALRQTNEDVIGWIFLPDTVISYPLLDSHDNAEYLNLTWDLQRSRSGSIFLERRSSTALDDFHTLIYGHNWHDGIMFSPLTAYADQDFFQNHPCIYIATDDAILQYTVFSAYTADVVSNTYRLVFEDDARKQECIDFWVGKSEVESDLVPTVSDRIVTLSTCTGRGIDGIRWVVHTVLTETYLR